MSREFKNPAMRTVMDYLLITASVFICTVGVYFFKFPNHFAFGGVTAFATVLSEVTDISPSQFTFLANIVLLAVGFLFLGRACGLKTVYAAMLTSGLLALFERFIPMSAPLTQEPLLELVFAVLIPAVGSALMFNIGVSAGGVDVIAMILKKYLNVDVGTSLFLLDMVPLTMTFFVFGPQTGLYTLLGLITKSVLVDTLIENLNMCKCFNIVCSNPDPICDYIINQLKRSATVYEAQGAYSHDEKVVILTTMRRGEAVRLRNYVRQIEPDAFMMISNSSEIIGRGFLAG